LDEQGYDTTEGEQASGDFESYLARPINRSRTEIRVNTTWQSAEPLGSFAILDKTPHSRESMTISRLDAQGIWTNCGEFQFELLSTDPITHILKLQQSVQDQLNC